MKTARATHKIRSRTNELEQSDKGTNPIVMGWENWREKHYEVVKDGIIEAQEKLLKTCQIVDNSPKFK